MINDDFDTDIDPNYQPVDTNSLKEKVPTFSSEKLCEIIVCDRYFGSYKELAIACMEELSTRRIAGDNFDFETHIDNSFKQLPQIDLSIPDLRDFLGQIVNGFRK